LALAHHLLSFGRLGPNGRIFGAAIQFAKTLFGLVRVKDTSSEARALLGCYRRFFALQRA
jgi:hypothetical protein